jgi:hypothetical protein
MEGAVNLKAIGFTQCISSFIPHTRSSQSFTATTKDFELIPFGNCSGAIETVIHDSAHNTIANGSTIVTGTVVHDKATVTFNSNSPAPSGVVTFKYFTPASNCKDDGTGTAASTSDPFPIGAVGSSLVKSIDSVSDASATPPPAAFTQTATAGTHAFQATYTGDSVYGDATSACEPFTARKPDTDLQKGMSYVITYTYTEENNGDVALTPPGGATAAGRDTVITDTGCSSVTYVSGDSSTTPPATANNFILDPGETWHFTCALAAKTANFASTNVATGDGTFLVDSTTTHLTFCADPNNPPLTPATQCDQDEQDTNSITVSGVNQGKDATKP